MLIRFEAAGDVPITRIELELDDDGEPPIVVTFPVTVGADGRYLRALAFKPTIEGIWPLRITAVDADGRSGATRCLPGVTVTR